MPKIKSIEELRAIRDAAQKDLTVAEKRHPIVVGMGTCGIAAGARETMHAILDELAKREIEANVTTVAASASASKSH